MDTLQSFILSVLTRSADMLPQPTTSSKVTQAMESTSDQAPELPSSSSTSSSSFHQQSATSGSSTASVGPATSLLIKTPSLPLLCFRVEMRGKTKPFMMVAPVCNPLASLLVLPPGA